ncbi:MAG: response regulator [Verrucomicrobiota bacterium]
MNDVDLPEQPEIMATIRECGKDEKSRLRLLSLYSKILKTTEEQHSHIIGVLDDDSMLVKYLDNFLQANHFQTLSATNAQAFLNLCESQKPSAILLDINMPDIDGGEMMNLLQANPETSNVPIIFMSGIIDQAEEKYLNQNSIENIRYLAKPFDTDRISQEINSILKRDNTIHESSKKDLTKVRLRVTRRMNSSGKMINGITPLNQKVRELYYDFGYNKSHVIPILDMLANRGKVYIESSEFAERWEMMTLNKINKSELIQLAETYA